MTDIHLSKSQTVMISWGITTVMAVFALALSVAWVRGLIKLLNGQDGLFKEQFAALVGLPAAGTLAFMLVVALRQFAGPIEMEWLGFKFKGAAGPAVLWMMLFLIVVWAIKMLWIFPSTA